MHHELSHIVDALPALVWTARADGYADFLNQRWCEYTGLQLDEALGWKWQRAIHPDDLPMLLEGWEAIVASGELGELQARIKRSDGAYRWFQFSACPLRDASGQVATWCGINTDIEDRHHTEEAARGYEDRFRLVIDGLPALVTMMNPAGELELVNLHVLEYFGSTLEEFKAREKETPFILMTARMC